MKRALRHLLFACCATCGLLPAAGNAETFDDLAPYKMLRSLQTVQDSLVLGDPSGADMQSFMLGTIDKRLRAADRSVFDDPRNVDAALIYAMSGGNPQTLAYLVSRDISGNFDNRITDMLGHYLAGKGALVVTGLSKTIDEYRDSRIGPYLYLVLGNAISQEKPDVAIGYYDWARLGAPGTNVEEAALRRSLMLSAERENPDAAFRYALSYARRFATSPYASRFADTLVTLAVEHDGDETRTKVDEVLGFLDHPRQREVFLRIARRAAIAGMQSLTKLASDRAGALSGENDAVPKALAALYSGLVDVPSTGILEAVEDMAVIPEAELSPRDRALRQAARAVAQEVLRAPQPSIANAPVAESPAQAGDVPIAAEEIAGDASDTGSGASPFATPPPAGTGEAQAAPAGEAVPQDIAAIGPADPLIEQFLSTGQTKLGQIDALLGKEN